MAVKIAISGFGRIGKLAFRQMFGDPDYEIVAINDTGTVEDAAYGLKYDSAHGSFKKDSITTKGNNLVVDGKEILVVSDRDPLNLPWKELDVDVVMECTGAFTSVEGASKHITAGDRKSVV